MTKFVHHRLTPSGVIALVALLVALSGTAVAEPVGDAAKALITGADIRNATLTGADVRNNSLTSQDVRDSSLLAKDFRSGQLPAGPQGPKGDKGDKGDKGEPGATNVTKRTSQGLASGSGATSTASVSCQDGERLVGGGVTASATAGARPTIRWSFPSTPSMWSTSVKNDGIAGTVTAYAIALCAAS
jgi:hypothetical protein